MYCWQNEIQIGNPEEANYSIFFLKIRTMVIVAGWWYLLWLFPLYARQCTLKRESRGDEALTMCALSLILSSLFFFFIYARLINWKKVLPIRAFSIVSIVPCADFPFSMILRCWMFFYSFSFSPYSRFLTLIRNSSHILCLFFSLSSHVRKRVLLPMLCMQNSSRKCPLIVP